MENTDGCLGSRLPGSWLYWNDGFSADDDGFYFTSSYLKLQASPITIPEISSQIVTSADRQPTCVSKEGKSASTIRNVIVAHQQNDTTAVVPVGLVMQVTSGPHGDFIACTQKEKQIRVILLNFAGPVKTAIFENEPSLFCCRYCR